MTDFLLRMGIVLKQLRRQRGLTQEELAAKAALHRTYISDVERGARNLSITCLRRLSNALETPLSEIFNHIEAGTTTPTAPGEPQKQM